MDFDLSRWSTAMVHTVIRKSVDTWVSGDVEVRIIERPDGRWSVRPPTDQLDRWIDVLKIVATQTATTLLTQTPSDAPQPVQDALRSAGFLPARHEQIWLIPLSHQDLPRAKSSLHQLIPVTAADPARVVALDNELRNDIPGTSGWTGTVEQLQDSLSDSDFDPDLYLIAQHPTGRYDGLVRVWNRSPTPRLGCVGVRRDWRRTRLAAALLSAVAHELLDRGIDALTSETDLLNPDSHSMARRLHSRPIALAVEWQQAPDRSA